VIRPSQQPAQIERDRLVEAHLPLVRSIARRYAGRGESLDDLVQAGAVGLVRASKRFDPKRGVAFATFVTPAIEGEIRRHLGDHATALRIPRQLQRRTGEVRRWREALRASLGRAPSAEELASALGVERGDVELALQAERAHGQAAGVPEALGSSPALPAASDPVLSASEDRLSVIDGARALDERERRILFLRFHADLTERDIARELGISQGTVSRLLSAALAKLRDQLAEDSVPIGADISRTAEAADARGDGAPPDGQINPRSPDGQAKPRSPDGQAKPPPDGQAKPSPDGQAKPPPDGQAKPPPDGQAKPPPDGQAKPSLDGQAKPRSPDGQARPLRRQPSRTRRADREETPDAGAGPSRRRSSTPSGRFLVRMPSELHQELSRAAEREQVSLNRYVTETLARSLSGHRNRREPESGASAAPQSRRRRFRVLVAANLAVIVLAATAAIVLVVLALERGI